MPTFRINRKCYKHKSKDTTQRQRDLLYWNYIRRPTKQWAKSKRLYCGL